MVSSDPTNELAQITEARREAKRWNAVDNFCKPFDFGDPDKALTGIAFLVVCDMLLTGFDAPIEQVMYIDKRLYEHNLLQAIARVNRVASGKQRGIRRAIPTGFPTTVMRPLRAGSISLRRRVYFAQFFAHSV